MCLIAFAIDADPACPLLIAANRDEFFDRPTEPLHRWALPDGTTVLAGRDLRDGGTWLGVGENGRVAMLTNVRSAQPGPGRRSRGELPARWLQSGTGWHSLLASIAPGDYGGFNLVVGDFRKGFWAWITNRNPERPHDEGVAPLHSERLLPGVYGLSNAALDTPWPKTLRLKNAVGMALGADSPQSLLALKDVLSDSAIANEEHQPSTGIPRDVEAALSSPFVDLVERGYGTRSSSLIVASRRGAPGTQEIQVDEWAHGHLGSVTERWASLGHRRERLSLGA
jgi:uncharacterized protein with NRDE domain